MACDSPSLVPAVIGIVGVVVGATLTIGKEWWFDRQKKTRHLKYLAARVITLLDEFVEGCANVTDDDGTKEGSPDEHDRIGKSPQRLQRQTYSPSPSN